ncbi:MAG: hypothetical protein FWG36_01580 [Oscillospiraceae bacterium]|nr:hypothetical protein [Oscillospiraceae bacterium]
MRKLLIRPCLLALLFLLASCGMALEQTHEESVKPLQLPLTSQAESLEGNADVESDVEGESIPPLTVNGWDVSVIIGLLSALDEAETLTPESGLLRKFPYPYKAMACVTSDCDGASEETFTSMHRYLNTFEDTPYGKGLGLDIANSFFVYNGSNLDDSKNLLSWFEGTNPEIVKNAEFIKKYWECGWIDSIHTFGDFSNNGRTRFTRELGLTAWKTLSAAGIHPTVWIDHGNAANVQNFGAYNPKNASSYQRGDDPDSQYYHTDVTLSGSVRFAWYSRHNANFGFDFPLSPRELRDGRVVWSFQRYTHNPAPDGSIDWTWRPNRLRDQITEKRLDELERKGQYSIIAQHMTLYQDEFQPGEEDLAALRMLAARFHQDETILVARASRLLAYAVAQKYAVFQYVSVNGMNAVRVTGIDDPVTGFRKPFPNELRGLTFYVPDPENTVIFVGDTLLPREETQVNAEDETGNSSVSVSWFKQDTFDYTK